MLKSMSIYQKDGKAMVKSNFVTSCLTFRRSIPIDNSSLYKEPMTWIFYATPNAPSHA